MPCCRSERRLGKFPNRRSLIIGRAKRLGRRSSSSEDGSVPTIQDNQPDSGHGSCAALCQPTITSPCSTPRRPLLGHKSSVCTDNLIRVDDVMESPKLAE